MRTKNQQYSRQGTGDRLKKLWARFWRSKTMGLVWVVCIATGAWNAFRFFCNRRQNAFNASSDGIREELLELFLLATERNYLLFRSTRGYVRIGTEQGLLKDTVCQKKNPHT